MVGLEEGVFPGMRSIGDETELEEERRLCYVGMTRAQEKLYMTNAFSRTLFGNTTYNRVSRFIKEIPAELIEGGALPAKKKDSFTSNSGIASENSKGLDFNTFLGMKGVTRGFGSNSTTATAASASSVKASAGSTFKPGDNVVHKKFGVGVITSMEKDNDDYRLEIQFKNSGMKRLMAAYANLTKL
jgi:Superfamily I DNA and RNA helicases